MVKLNVLDMLGQIEFSVIRKDLDFNEKIRKLKKIAQELKEAGNWRVRQASEEIIEAADYINKNITFITGLAMYYFKRFPRRRVLNLTMVELSWKECLILEISKDLEMRIAIKSPWIRKYNLQTEVEAYKKTLAGW